MEKEWIRNVQWIFVVMDGVATQLSSAFDHVSLVEPINGRYNTILRSSPSGVDFHFFSPSTVLVPRKIYNQTPTFDKLVVSVETAQPSNHHLGKTTFLLTRHSLVRHRTALLILVGP